MSTGLWELHLHWEHGLEAVQRYATALDCLTEYLVEAAVNDLLRQPRQPFVAGSCDTYSHIQLALEMADGQRSRSASRAWLTQVSI